jgi:hypothetical protein
MSKGNDKKSKAGKTSANASISSYKSAQTANKPAASPFARKPGIGQKGPKGA